MNVPPQVSIIGGGLAGSEAALQLAKRGIAVRLYEMKPIQRSPAHHSDHLAEIVCSNSFGNLQLSTASGLLKAELAMLGCELIQTAERLAVPAGNALAVDRERFAETITHMVDTNPLIERISNDQTTLPTDTPYTIIATGPLTSAGLSETLQSLLNQKQLYFFDAAAPIVMRDSINFEVAFYQNRYDKAASPDQSGEGSYINCPLNQAQYDALVNAILTGEKATLKDFESSETYFFESCLPIDVLASRGHHTLRYGPMKPVGIVNPHSDERPYAVVQLRQDNAEGTLYNLVGFQTNLKWGAQKELIQMIPGLENAEIVRYGVMHRNTFINSPQVLNPTMQLRTHPHILVAGQLTGVEGYTESIAAGLMAAISVARLLNHKETIALPSNTMMGALFQYITRSEAKHFQPINSNWGILPALNTPVKDKKRRNNLLAERALDSLKQFIKDEAEFAPPSSHAAGPVALQTSY